MEVLCQLETHASGDPYIEQLSFRSCLCKPSIVPVNDSNLKCDMKDEGYNLVADSDNCPFWSFVSTYGVRYIPVIGFNLKCDMKDEG